MCVRNRIFSLLYKIVLLLLCAIGLLFLAGVPEGAFDFAIFNYFTIISSLFSLVFYIVSSVFLLMDITGNGTRGDSSFAGNVKGAAIVALLASMILFLLDSVFGGTTPIYASDTSLFASIGNIILHIVVPIVALLDWCLFDPKGLLRATDPVVWLLIPYCYYTYVLIRAQFGIVYLDGALYPYIFLNAQQLGWQQVLLNIGLMTLAFLALGYVLFGLDVFFGATLRRRERQELEIDDAEREFFAEYDQNYDGEETGVLPDEYPEEYEDEEYYDEDLREGDSDMFFADMPEPDEHFEMAEYEELYEEPYYEEEPEPEYEHSATSDLFGNSADKPINADLSDIPKPAQYSSVYEQLASEQDEVAQQEADNFIESDSSADPQMPSWTPLSSLGGYSPQPTEPLPPLPSYSDASPSLTQTLPPYTGTLPPLSPDYAMPPSYGSVSQTPPVHAGMHYTGAMPSTAPSTMPPDLSPIAGPAASPVPPPSPSPSPSLYQSIQFPTIRPEMLLAHEASSAPPYGASSALQDSLPGNHFMPSQEPIPSSQENHSPPSSSLYHSTQMPAIHPEYLQPRAEAPLYSAPPIAPAPAPVPHGGYVPPPAYAAHRPQQPAAPAATFAATGTLPGLYDRRGPHVPTPTTTLPPIVPSEAEHRPVSPPSLYHSIQMPAIRPEDLMSGEAHFAAPGAPAPITAEAPMAAYPPHSPAPAENYTSPSAASPYPYQQAPPYKSPGFTPSAQPSEYPPSYAPYTPRQTPPVATFTATGTLPGLYDRRRPFVNSAAAQNPAYGGQSPARTTPQWRSVYTGSLDSDFGAQEGFSSPPIMPPAGSRGHTPPPSATAPQQPSADSDIAPGNSATEISGENNFFQQ